MRYVCYCFVVSHAGNPRDTLDSCKLAKDILAKNTNYLDNVLETLDIQQHTIGVMFVVVAKFSNITVSSAAVLLGNHVTSPLSTLQASPANTENIVKYVRDFVQLSNTDQIRFAAGTCKI